MEHAEIGMLILICTALIWTIGAWIVVSIKSPHA